MKKWIKVVIIIIICAIFFIPIRTVYKDGGTVVYRAILYSVGKIHSVQPQGYSIGTRVRFLFWTVYDDVEFVPNN